MRLLITELDELTAFSTGAVGLAVAQDRSCATLAIGDDLVDLAREELEQLRDLARLLASPAVLAALGLYQRPVDDCQPDPGCADALVAWLNQQFAR